MKNALLTLAVALAACRSIAGSEDDLLRQELFGASFTNAYYSSGVQLCDTGVVHGTWGSVPSGAAVAVKEAGRTYMEVLSPVDSIVFTPLSVSAKRISSTSASVCTFGYEDLSQVPSPTGARAAFAIHAPPVGETNFIGWVCSKNCWTNLYPKSGSDIPNAEAWQEVMVKFLKADAGREYVQYRLKRESDSGYVPLGTADGVYWIDAGTEFNTGMSGKVGFVGEGGLERISGTEPRRGLVVGIGTWYDFRFSESIYIKSPNSVWENGTEPFLSKSEANRSYQIGVDKGDESVTYKPYLTHDKSNVEVTEIELEFTGENDDDSIPEDASARVRLVEAKDGTFRFACLADGQWRTNGTPVSVTAKYTVEISLDNGSRTVSYRVKEGYGLEGGAYRDLCSGKMLPNATGKTMNIDFDGYGFVHEIRGKVETK